MSVTKFSDETIRIVIDGYSGGMPVKQILQDAGGISSQTLYRILDDNNVPRRPKVGNGKKVGITIREDNWEWLQHTDVSYTVNLALDRYHRNQQRRSRK